MIRFAIVLLIIHQVVGEYGVLYVQSPEINLNKTYYCFAYNADFKKISSAFNKSDVHDLVDLSSEYGCTDIYNGTVDVRNKLVAVARGECTFVEKARLAQTYNASGVVVVLYKNDTKLISPGGNKTAGDFQDINIVVGTILWKDFQSISSNKSGGDSNVSIWMYTPSQPRLDPDMVIIYALALICIIVGAYWSGITRFTIAEQKWKRKKTPSGSSKSGEENNEEQPETLNINLVTVLVLFVLICSVIILLYFFYDYLVYVVIALFCLAGSIGLYSCLFPLWIRLVKADCSIPRLPCCSARLEVREIVLALLSIGFTVFWAVERKASYAWILQDILGTAFCINMLKTIRLPHLMACTILLVLLLIYDIFFVFITPLFTKSGDSIMVDVATGGKSHSGEQLPMVFKVPRFIVMKDAVCYKNPYSLLGFGDVIVPGLLISFNHGFDLLVGSRRIYFITTTIAYGVGLIFTYVALALMEKGQPALLYLVPCTLLTTVFIACRRGELSFMWRGMHPKKDDNTKTDEHRAPTGPPTCQHAESDSSLSSDERRGLLNINSQVM